VTPLETRDRALALAFKQGEREAYVQIYELHHSRVLNLCKRMLGNTHDAEEATQEVFLRVFQGLQRFNGRYLLGAWILRIATNVCLDSLRSRGRRPMSVELDECMDTTIDDEADPQVRLLRSSEGSRVRRTLKRLPPMHRAALVLRDLEGLSYDEIAVVLGITSPQVKALIHRARQGFKRSWPSHLAEILVPARLLHRLRAAESVTHEASQVGQLASNAAPYAASCSTFIQQCGAFATERAAAVVAVFIVGASAVVPLANASDPQPKPSASSTVVQKVVVQAKRIERHRVRRVAEAPDSSPSVPTTEPTPAPPPQPDPTPTSAPDTEPSPAGSPITPTEPEGLTVGFAAGIGPGYACSCAGQEAEELSSSLGLTAGGLQNFNQSLEGSASVDGIVTYGLAITHSGDPSHHTAVFHLSTAEGAYRYDASGSFLEAQQTAWGGVAYTYAGTYALTGYPSRDEDVPKAGSYRATVIFSTASHRIVAVSFTLNES
jgi:RNA polymerase sigma-70 factor (ECF subfamily)